MLKAEKPTESPEGRDVVQRLMDRLGEEGFSTEVSQEDWERYGEIIFTRSEKISMAAGETVFIFTRISELNERILRQTSETVVNTYKAKSLTQKALSVFQSTTIYHCLVVDKDQPYAELLDPYVTRAGGATFLPVIMVPEINQVLYPELEERVGTMRPRVEYLQYLLGELRIPVDLHKTTLQAFYVSLAVVAVLVVAIVLSAVI